MKPSCLFSLSLLISLSFACKREDGPISPEAGKKISVGNLPSVPETGGANIDPEEPGEPSTSEIGEPHSMLPEVEEIWAHQTAATLQSYYDAPKFSYRDSTDVSAHALTALIDFMKLSGSREYVHIVSKIFDNQKAVVSMGDVFFGNFLWATAWINGYDLIGDKRFLDFAKLIADDMDATAWDASTCGGGVITSRTVKTKVSATNIAYIQLMGALHNRTPGDTKYLELASKGWVWFMASGMYNSAGLANNGQTTRCKNDGLQTWTHSQGLLISAALELYKAAPKPEYLDVAKKAAQAASTTLVADGVLREANDKSCGTCLAEERIFKGIFIRSLREAQAEWKDDAIQQFLFANINKVWNGARSTSDMIGFHWQSSFDSSDAGRQAAALDLMNAALVPKETKNLAQGRVAQTTANCATNETGAAALDGSAASKWCAAIPVNGTATMVIDLGMEMDIKRVKILHGGAGAENLNSNTRDFVLSTGTSATGPFIDLVRVENNTSSASFHVMVAKTRYVRLSISKGGADGIARIFEVAIE